MRGDVQYYRKEKKHVRDKRSIKSHFYLMNLSLNVDKGSKMFPKCQTLFMYPTCQNMQLLEKANPIF